MNIYQNGAFSEILHKLTKYQALAASAKDFSKQNLYSQKIQEYRNRLDTMNFAQSGGALTQAQQTQKNNLVEQINKLLPEKFEQNYSALKKSHDYVLSQLIILKDNINGLILQKKIYDDQQREYDSQLSDLRKKNKDLNQKLLEKENLERELAELKAQMRQKGVADAATRARMQELQRQINAAQSSVIEILPNDGLRAQITQLSTKNGELQGQLENTAAELAQLKARGSVSTNCDAEITDILTAIDGAVSNVNAKSFVDESSQISELQTLVKTMVNNIGSQTATNI